MANKEAKAAAEKFQRPKSSSTPKSQFGNNAPKSKSTSNNLKEKTKPKTKTKTKNQKTKERERESEIKHVQPIHQSIKIDMI